jgi:hypothetical protein
MGKLLCLPGLKGGGGRRGKRVVNAAPALDTALRTVVPIALLVGAGVGARATGVLRAGGCSSPPCAAR